jgi:hypothetical protein
MVNKTNILKWASKYTIVNIRVTQLYTYINAAATNDEHIHNVCDTLHECIFIEWWWSGENVLHMLSDKFEEIKTFIISPSWHSTMSRIQSAVSFTELNFNMVVLLEYDPMKCYLHENLGVSSEYNFQRQNKSVTIYS